jgi:hypothetical protein
MPAVNSSELQTISDWMSSGVGSILTDSCAVQRENGSSQWVTVTSPDMSAVPCAIVGPAQDEKDVANEVTGAVLKTVLMPRNTDVRSPDRLLINGITYRVYDVKDPSTFEVLRRVTVTRFPQRGGA